MAIQHKRPASAMIELIFAIVVMGIVMMSAPMLISMAGKSTAVALQQEGINEAVSRVSMILTYEWDQNDLNESCIPPVLHVTAGDTLLEEVGTTARRIGVPLDTDSRTFKCINKEFNATLTQDGTDDIDDFSNTTQIVEISDLTEGIDYIEKTTVNIATSIYYTPDTANYNTASFSYSFAPGSTATGGSSNIKAISVTLTSSHSASELSKTIKLHAFSCNIGGVEFKGKEF